MAKNIHIAVWVMTSCNLVDGYQYFRETYCLQFLVTPTLNMEAVCFVEHSYNITWYHNSEDHSVNNYLMLDISFRRINIS